MSIAIKAEHLSKAYQLGQIGTGTISRDIERWWITKVRKKEDPLLKIGEVNDRSKKGESDVVWSLNDINFEIEQGDAVGIIGRNGAGKSTLLKILSEVTSPTKGLVNIKGRIASLLEVGTGFHPELSGRENIFLNGAILGMRRREIERKLDEIVAFSGVERYLDTPVKRYSSGMYVRLAFAVAAHLESEILVVDEVLAVGDAEFQKKCLGKMSDISHGQGRTVLFVSHNMDSITRLCNKSIVLKNGELIFDGKAEQGIKKYFEKENISSAEKRWENGFPGNSQVKLTSVALIDSSNNLKDVFRTTEGVGIKIEYTVLEDDLVFTHGLNLFNEQNVHILSSHDIQLGKSRKKFKKGSYVTVARIPPNLLAEGLVSLSVAIMSYDPYIVHFHEKEVLIFSVIDNMDGNSARGVYGGHFPGVVRPIIEWDEVINL